MNASPPLQIKAHRDSFLLVPDPLAPFPDITDFLKRKMDESKSFFLRSKMILDLRKRPFRLNEVEAIRDLLKDAADVRLTEVYLGKNLQSFLRWASQNLGISMVADMEDEARPSSGSLNHEQRTSSDSAQTRVIRTTCRSGTRVESSSDCIVLGDVNPGAEILAAGDIVVFGNLRGVAHAGVLGDRSARIMALSIEPNQIRIADVVALPPRGGKPTPKRFEVAEIRGGLIEVTTM